MTRESWHDGTYSHEWGASPLAGVAWGLLGSLSCLSTINSHVYHTPT